MKKTNKYYDKTVLTSVIPLKDGKRDTIINWLYDVHLVEWYATYLLSKSMDDDDTQDKIQTIWEQICMIPQDKWDYLYEQGKYSISAYVTGIIHQQLISDSSECYKLYNRHSERFITQDENFWEKYNDEN